MQDSQMQRLWQSELAISRADAKQTRFQLAEAKRQLEALRSRNAQLEAERKCQNEIIAKALAALKKSECAEAAELAPRLETILEGTGQIRQVISGLNPMS